MGSSVSGIKYWEEDADCIPSPAVLATLLLKDALLEEAGSVLSVMWLDLRRVNGFNCWKDAMEPNRRIELRRESG